MALRTEQETTPISLQYEALDQVRSVQQKQYKREAKRASYIVGILLIVYNWHAGMCPEYTSMCPENISMIVSMIFMCFLT